MFTKTTDKNHRGSLGVLGDLIRKHGAESLQVASYVDRFKDDMSFMKRASMLVTAGLAVSAIKNESIKQTEE